MAKNITEKKFLFFPPKSFITDGDEDGKLQVLGACQFRVGQIVVLKANAQPDFQVKVVRINSDTEIEVGDKSKAVSPNNRLDISGYTVADSATIELLVTANDTQDRMSIAPDDLWRAVYEEEPVIALRTIMVDECGDQIGQNPDSPVHVQLSNGSIDIGDVNAELEVQLSHRDNFPDAGDVADSTQVGDGEEIMEVNPDGSINTSTTQGVSSLDYREDTINNITYRGTAAPGSSTADPVWKISRTVRTFNNTTGVDDEITLVAGTGAFDQVWDDRASLFPSSTPIDFSDRRIERVLPLLANANFLKLGDPDRIAPTFNADDVEIDYFQNSANIAKARVRYVNELDWEINLERYINDSDGDILLDDDDTPLFLD